MKLNWQNPATDLNGNTLDGITSVTIRRNFELIAELTNAEVGASMEYEDNGLEPGLYEYAIFVTNEAGISQTEYQSILVGEKCDIVFQLHDNGGNGWKGAAISVTSESGQRIAIVTMTEGSEQTITLPLLKGNLNFIWNHGWYHAYEEHDTDGECSFSILDGDGNELYASGELEDGIFLTHNNDCDWDEVTETVINQDIQVYPNPTSGLLNVNGNGTMHISISNLLGQKVMELNAEGNTSIDLSRFDTGFYLIRIETENGVSVQKINLRK